MRSRPAPDVDYLAEWSCYDTMSSHGASSAFDREYARLQQFPTTWKFVGSLQQRYMQIGNAVPVGLGEAIGKALNKTIRRTARLELPEDAEERKESLFKLIPLWRSVIDSGAEDAAASAAATENRR